MCILEPLVEMQGTSLWLVWWWREDESKEGRKQSLWGGTQQQRHPSRSFSLIFQCIHSLPLLELNKIVGTVQWNPSASLLGGKYKISCISKSKKVKINLPLGHLIPTMACSDVSIFRLPIFFILYTKFSFIHSFIHLFIHYLFNNYSLLFICLFVCFFV